MDGVRHQQKELSSSKSSPQRATMITTRLPSLRLPTVRRSVAQSWGVAIVALTIYVLGSMLLFPTRRTSTLIAPSLPKSGTATSGRLFRMRRERTLDESKLIFQHDQQQQRQPQALTSTSSTDQKSDFVSSIVPANNRTCRYWGTLTTIFNVTEGALSLPPDWCLVVAGDRKGPFQYDNGRLANTTVFLDVHAQLQLARHFDLVEHLPWNHFGRKNVAYLYAVLAGAEWIWDFDDDNILYNDTPVSQHIVESIRNVLQIHTAQPAECGVLNPYRVLKRANTSTVDARLWPRGYPLESIRDPACRVESTCVVSNIVRDDIGIYQSLADQDPDVDAIYRLTADLPVFFERRSSQANKDNSVQQAIPAALLVPPQTLTPMNAQAALVHVQRAAWSLFLPTTVHGRVSDIWRSYFAQAVGRWFGLRTVVLSQPLVRQDRNVHTYLADFNAEIPLYERAGALVEYLNAWEPPRHNSTLPEALERLYAGLYEHGILEWPDVVLMQHWLKALQQVHYTFPAWNPVMEQPISNDCVPGTIPDQLDHTSTPPAPLRSLESPQRQYYYDDVMLVGQFNYNIEVNHVIHWVQRWSEFFRTVHVRGPFNSSALNELRDNGVRVFVAPDYKGLSSPMLNLADSMRLAAEDASIRGVILSHDDLIFNLTHLETLGFPSDTNVYKQGAPPLMEDPYLVFSNQSTFHHWNGKRSFAADDFHQSAQLEDWSWWKNSIPPFAHATSQDPRASQFANEDGTFFMYGHAFSDFVYVPTAYSKPLIAMADWLYDHRVFLEVGIPTLVGYLKDHYHAKVKHMSVCTTYSTKQRKDFTSWAFACALGDAHTAKTPASHSPPYGTYHPIKLSARDIHVWDIMFDMVNPHRQSQSNSSIAQVV